MSERGGAVHVVTTRRTYKGRVYETHLLRRSYREDGRVKNETLGNLSHLPEPVVDLVRRALRGEAFVPVAERLEVLGSRPHGHVQAVRLAMQRLGIESLIGSRASPERDRVCALIAARILAPHTKLATTRWWHTSTLAEEFGVSAADEDDLYAAMDWLLERQPLIERKLAARHLGEGSLALYDLDLTRFGGRLSKSFFSWVDDPPFLIRNLHSLVRPSAVCRQGRQKLWLFCLTEKSDRIGSFMGGDLGQAATLVSPDFSALRIFSVHRSGRPLKCKSFVGRGRAVAQRGVSAMRVVPTFQPREHGHPCLDLTAKALPVDHFALKSCKKRLRHRIVVRIADRSHGGHDAGFATAFAERVAGVLAPMVRMMDDIDRTPLCDRHVQRRQHQLGAQVIGHRPADDLARIHVQHHCEEQKPGPGRDVRRVSHPQPIRCFSIKPPLHQILRRLDPRRRPGGHYCPPRRYPSQMRCPHEPRNTLSTHTHTMIVSELRMDHR